MRRKCHVRIPCEKRRATHIWANFTRTPRNWRTTFRAGKLVGAVRRLWWCASAGSSCRLRGGARTSRVGGGRTLADADTAVFALGREGRYALRSVAVVLGGVWRRLNACGVRSVCGEVRRRVHVSGPHHAMIRPLTGCPAAHCILRNLLLMSACGKWVELLLGADICRRKSVQTTGNNRAPRPP